jgi:hypothetical protein
MGLNYSSFYETASSSGITTVLLTFAAFFAFSASFSLMRRLTDYPNKTQLIISDYGSNSPFLKLLAIWTASFNVILLPTQARIVIASIST